MFKSLSELMTSVGKTDAHKVSIVQVKTGVTSWGRKNQSSRPTAEYQIWMDTPDNDSRIVLKLNFVLSSRRNQPEKNAPLKGRQVAPSGGRASQISDSDTGFDLPKDPRILKAVFQHNEGHLGVKADVVRQGRVATGDVVQVE